MAALRYFGGWRKALTAAGLDPQKVTQEAYRQLHCYPDKEAVIQGIRQRLRKGLQLNRVSIHASKPSLAISGVDFFGSWDNALKAAGVNPELIHQALKRKGKYATKQDIIREIRARYKRKWAINHADLYRGKNKNRYLAHCACKYFGSWNNALKASGFDPIKIHQQVMLRHK
jgi:molybdenum cofactor biosynthesis enzyme MoaA